MLTIDVMETDIALSIPCFRITISMENNDVDAIRMEFTDCFCVSCSGFMSLCPIPLFI